MKNKVILISSFSPSLINFRGDLINDFLAKGYDVLCIGPDENTDVISSLNSIGVRYKRIAFKRNGVSVLSDLILLFKLIYIFKTEKPDVVLSYTIKPLIYGSISAYFTNVKTRISLVTGLGYSFAQSEGNRTDTLLKTISKFLYKLGVRSSTHVLFQNPDDRNLLLKLKFVSEGNSVVTNGSGINLEKFCSSSLPPILPVRFLMISRLIKEKGVLYFIDAAKLLKEKYLTQVEFDLVGWSDNEKNSISSEYINEVASGGIVNFHGKLNDVRSVINDCSVFVLPSYYPEGTPRTILEAMSMGRAIITTDSVGCRETVINEYNGFLIEPKNTQDLISKMELFISHTDSIRSMGESSLSLAAEKFDVSKVNKSIFDFCGL